LTTLQILDTTLREGELFETFPLPIKLQLAIALSRVGIRRIEMTLDYPPRTKRADLESVIAALKESGTEVILHGRACDSDVERISTYEVGGCGLYIAISDLHRENKLHGMSEMQSIEQLSKAVQSAKNSGMRYIRATLEDASRLYVEKGESGVETIARATELLRDAGATMVSVPDTSGLMTPRAARAFFARLKQTSALPLSAHFHNDYGLSSANTIEAALEGADEVQVTMLGIGDRNGIADLYEVVSVLEDINGLRTGVDRRRLREAYATFTKTTGIRLPWRHPLSEEAQTIRAGVHQSMTIKRPDGYIPSGKLENDFLGPAYAINQYVGHNLIHNLLSEYIPGLEKDSSLRVTEMLAVSARDGRTSITKMQEIIKSELGLEIPRTRLASFFGGQRAYLLLKLKPQYPGQSVAAEVRRWDCVESVDEVYGEADMIITMRLDDDDRPLNLLRNTFGEAIQEMRVLLAD
jgi:isopropylmalate/homocitrate/citramalate synthase